MLTITCFKWKGWRGNTYQADHVNRLQRMVKRHLQAEHEFVCITDDPRGVKARTIPLWEGLPGLTAEPDKKPNCYKRLRLFSDDSPITGPVLAIDLDCIITGPLDPLLPDTGFKILKGYSCPYNGSLWYVEPGYRPDVWRTLNTETAEQARSALPGATGSDQVWLSHMLPGHETWGPEDGIYQHARGPEPADDARIIFFAGAQKPWDRNCKLRDRYITESS